MTDARFYKKPKPISVEAIIELIGGKSHEGTAGLMVNHIAPIDKVESGGLCFAASKRAAEQVKNEKGVICLVSPEYAENLGEHICAILSMHPKRDFGRVITTMFEEPSIEERIHPSAVIAETAKLGKGCTIEANTVIGEGAELGAGCQIGAGSYIGQGCILGEGCILEPNVKISHAIIGKQAQLGAGVVIGSAGFGIVDDGEGNQILPHLGRVLIGDNCHFGPNTTIDRGFIDDTIIGNRVMLDNQVMIAHNVVLGDNNILCAQVAIAGSTVIGDNNVFGGQAGVADHLTVGSNNVFAGQAGLTKSIGDDQILAGFPAKPAIEFRREVATLKRLAQSKER